MKRPLLALEEHYYSSAIYSSLNEEFVRVLKAVPDLTEQLLDVGEKRLANMDAGSVAFQVVSHAFTPGKNASAACARRPESFPPAEEKKGKKNNTLPPSPIITSR